MESYTSATVLMEWLVESSRGSLYGRAGLGPCFRGPAGAIALVLMASTRARLLVLAWLTVDASMAWSGLSCALSSPWYPSTFVLWA